MDVVLGGGRDVGTLFERARRLGFAGVEVVLLRQDLSGPGRRRLGELRRAVVATGLRVPSLVLDEHNAGGIASPDPAVAMAAADDVGAAVAWAAELGADAVLVPFFGQAVLVDADDLDRAAAAFRALCPAAERAGVQLLYEGLLPSSRVRALAAAVSSPAFGVYFDVANPLRRGLDPATELRALGSLVRRVHVKDSRSGPADVPPGLGRVDFDDCARALQDVGYDGWLVLETAASPPELVARDLSFVRTRFGGLEPPARAWPRLGAFSYDFGRGELGRLAETFARYGLETVQLGTGLLDECLERPERAESTRGQLADRGIDVAALAGYRNLIAPDDAVREANIGFIERCLELAPLLGTSVVATETGTRNPESDWGASPENWTEASWSTLLDALERLLPVAERHGSILALEATVKHVLATEGQLLGLLDRFPTQHLQVVLDPYNVVSGPALPAVERTTAGLLDRLEHRFVLAHLKDVGPGGAEDSTPELGTGVFPQRPYLDFLRRRRPDLPLILEHLPLEHLPRAAALVRELAP
jgi:sugar phosphate isomerase/epimerase